jgi:hypothetical protein
MLPGTLLRDSLDRMIWLMDCKIGATLCVDKSRRKLVSLRVTTKFSVIFFLMQLATSQETIQRSSPQQLSRFR